MWLESQALELLSHLVSEYLDDLEGEGETVERTQPLCGRQLCGLGHHAFGQVLEHEMRDGTQSQ